MKNSSKAFLSLILVIFLASSSFFAMENNEQNNKRARDPLDEAYNEITKRFKIGMKDDDWHSMTSLINNGNQDEIINCYLEKIFNENQLEYMALLAITHDLQDVLNAIKGYGIPVLNAILEKKNDILKKLIKDNAFITMYHVHIAMKNNCSDEMVESLLTCIKKEDLQNYSYDEEILIVYALIEDGLDKYLDLLIKYGCIIGYNEMKTLIENEPEKGLYFDLFLINIKDINEKPVSKGKSLLWHCVIQAKRADWLKNLLEKGARVEKQDIVDNFALNVKEYKTYNSNNTLTVDDFVFDEKSIELGKILLENFCNSNKADSDFIEKICKQQAIQNFMFLKVFDDYKSNRFQLHECLHNIKNFLVQGVDPNLFYPVEYKDGSIGYMPIIQMAANYEWHDIVFLLLAYGAHSSDLLFTHDLRSYSDEIKDIAKFALSVKILKRFYDLHSMKNYNDITSFLKINIKKCRDANKIRLSRAIFELYGSYTEFARDIINFDSKEGLSSLFRSYEKNLYDAYFVTHPWIKHLIASKFHTSAPFFGISKQERTLYEKWIVTKLKKSQQAKKRDFFAPINLLKSNNDIFSQHFADIVFEVSKNN